MSTIRRLVAVATEKFGHFEKGESGDVTTSDPGLLGEDPSEYHVFGQLSEKIPTVLA